MKRSKYIKHHTITPELIFNFLQFLPFCTKNKLFNLVTFTTVLIITLFFTSQVSYADNLSSPAYEIKMGTINITGGSKTSSSYKLNDTVGQTAQGEFNSAGFTVKAGFQYVRSTNPFTFSISNIDLDYGSLVPGTPSTLTNTLNVTNGSAYGFTVKAIEDHSLKLLSNSNTIPDTSCDVGLPCSTTDATPWTDNSQYGFGYSVSGTDADSDFVNSTYFRPFPIQGVNQPALLMSRSSVTTGSSATVTYKVNISGSQAAGTYQNGIQFIAVPAF